MFKKKIVVTGLGIASSLGLGTEQIRKTLAEKPLGKKVTLEILNEAAKSKYGSAFSRRLDSFCKYGLLAASEAMEISGIRDAPVDSLRKGGIFATVWGPIETTYQYFEQVLEKGPGYASPFLFPYTVTNAITGSIARMNGLNGVSTMLVGCCPLNYACELIDRGNADAVLAGGIDSAASFLSKQHGEQGAEELFEGAAIAMIESEEHALRRHAKIYCEIRGFARGNVAACLQSHNHEKATALVESIIRSTLEKTRTKLEEVDLLISMQDGWESEGALAETELRAWRKLGGEASRLVRPWRLARRSHGAQSTLNLCAAIWALEEEGIAKRSSRVLSSACFYGGNLSSQLITEHAYASV
jgi:3-oxoacyl-[acyl-carrier-protein] synthase II